MIPPPALPTTMALLNRIDQHHFNLPLSPLNTIKQTINKPTPKTLDTKAAPPTDIPAQKEPSINRTPPVKSIYLFRLI
jgi:hypothetical protein